MRWHDRGGGLRAWSTPSADGTALAAVALLAVTLAAAAGMGRLFRDGSALVPLVTAAVVAHGVCLSGRRLGASALLAAVAALAAVGLAAMWAVLPHTTAYGIPTPETLGTAVAELARARALFSEVSAPAPVAEGFLIAAMLAVGGVAVLADWSASRLQGRFDAVWPSFVLFAFTSVMGANRHRLLATIAYLASVTWFLLAQQAAVESTARSWLRTGLGPGRWRWASGSALAATGLVAGLVVGPSVPGSDRAPVLSWRDGRSSGSGGGRTTANPLVDLRAHLVDQSDREVFTVRARVPSYWRLTALDSFNGQVWSSEGRYRPAPDRLPDAAPSRTRTVRLAQEFRLSGLSSAWLPAAYRPERVEGVDGLRYDDRLQSLTRRGGPTEGLTYSVESAVPSLGPGELAGAGPGTPGDPRLRPVLALPAVPSRVRQLAQEVTSAAGDSPFAKAVALQAFFHREFAYDLGVQPGHDARALETFLFRSRRGYCEQFAASYAVLARAVGLPARLAVGFTPGDRGPDGRYHVRGLNAHAWPEVHLDGFGWVAFEPTPGRGPPAGAHTGLPESQAAADRPTTATTAAPSPTTPAPAPAGPGTAAAGQAPEPPGRPPARSSPLPAAALVPVVLGAVALLAVPLAKRARRRRRRARAATPGEKVLAAWWEAAETLAAAGTPRAPAETPAEHARRAVVSNSLPEPAAAALSELAGSAAMASYGRGPVNNRMATQAVSSLATVEKALWHVASPAQRLKRALDPRPLLARPRTARR